MKVKAHSISIPAFLKVGRGTLGYLGEFLSENKFNRV